MAAALACAPACLPTRALAAEAAVDFRIPAQALDSALVAFGLQGNVSVGSGDLARCGPQARAVNGRMLPSRALAQLLSGTGCTFVAVDPRAFSVIARPDPPAPASAPPPSSPSAAEPTAVSLLDLTVTTTRRPSLVSRTPASVSVASGPALSQARIDNLQELAPEFAGVTVTNLGPGRNKIFIRGLSDGAFTGRTQSTVGLYLDDVPITYNAPDPDLRLVDMERIELMRGPQGTLYGVGSMGGIVRLVTAKPSMEAFDTGAAVAWATTQRGGPSYSADLMVNIPLAVGKAAVRALAYQDVEGGYVDDISLHVFNANTTTRMGGRIAASLQLSDAWRLTAGANHQSLRASDSQYAEGRLPGLQRDILTREPHNNDFTQGYLTLEGSTSLGEFKASASYINHDFDTRYDASTGLPVFESTSPFRLLDQADKVRLAVAEAVLTSPTNGRFQWLAGVFGSRTLDDLTLDIGALQPTGARDQLYFEDRQDRMGEVAAYGEASYALTRTLILTGGARVFYAWTKTDSHRDQAGVVRDFSGSRTSSDVSPKVVLSWQPAPARLFYVQAAQGYRTAGFNTTGRITQQFNAGTTGNQPNRVYNPDALWSFEAGAKLVLADRLQLRSALFYNDWRDVQSDQLLPSGLPYVANVGRAVNTGLEGEAAFHAGGGVDVRLSFLANSPELRQRDKTYPARPNASLPAVPRYSGALIVEWRRPLGGGIEMLLSGRATYVGASVLTFQEQASSSMGDYITARLTAGLSRGRWRLAAVLDNPGDTRGDTFAFGDPFTQGRVRQFTPLRPRTVGISLSHNL